MAMYVFSGPSFTGTNIKVNVGSQADGNAVLAFPQSGFPNGPMSIRLVDEGDADQQFAYTQRNRQLTKVCALPGLGNPEGYPSSRDVLAYTDEIQAVELRWVKAAAKVPMNTPPAPTNTPPRRWSWWERPRMQPPRQQAIDPLLLLLLAQQSQGGKKKKKKKREED